MTINDISSINPNFELNTPKLPKPYAILKVAEKINSKYKEFVPKSPPNIDEIFNKARGVFSGDIKGSLSDKEIKSLAYASFDNQADDIFFNNLIKAIKQRSRKSHYRALMTCYVMSFSRQNPKCRKIASTLSANKDKLSRAWVRRIDYLNLLAIDSIEGKLAKKILENPDEQRVFEESGLVGVFGSSGLVNSAIITVAQIIRKEITNDDDSNFDQFIELITDNGKIKSNFGPASMIALLLPFVDKSPPPGIKNKLKDLFLKSFHDPRISRHRWPEIDTALMDITTHERCISLIRKWLNSDSIDLFFKIIQKHAPSVQFEPRQKLWQTYFDQDHVADAWVILGSEAFKTAQIMKKTDDTATSLRWAKLAGVLSDQSVLLMEIGNLVVAEWSHSGKFRAWYRDSQDRPQFYRSEYTGTGLRQYSNTIENVSGGWSDGITHNGNWVARAQSYISEETGIRLSRKIR